MEITPKEAAAIIKQLEIIHNLLEKVNDKKDCDEPLRLISIVMQSLSSEPSYLNIIKWVEKLVYNYVVWSDDYKKLSDQEDKEHPSDLDGNLDGDGYEIYQACGYINTMIEDIEEEFEL